MHAIVLQTSQLGRHLDYLTSMYRLRRRVFKDRLIGAYRSRGIWRSTSMTRSVRPIFLRSQMTRR